jgi:hypothetical protein
MAGWSLRTISTCSERHRSAIEFGQLADVRLWH